MLANMTFPHKSLRNIIIITVITLLLFVSVFAFAKAETNESQNITEEALSTFTFTLAPNGDDGDTVSPTFYSSSSKDINFSFEITGTTSSEAELTIFNGSNSEIWNGSASGNELVWGNTTLTNGNNMFAVQNNSAESLTFTLRLFNIPEVPTAPDVYSWLGHAAEDGLNSEIDIDFPVNGLYTFDFYVNGRYEFMLGSNDIQRTVTTNDSVSLYVEAGVQTITIVQDNSGGLVDWQVDIAYSDTAVDSLPYAKENDAIETEIIPIHLSAPATVNMVITATGTVDDQLFVDLVGATPQTVTDANVSVYAGETTWTTFNLPAGTSNIQLTTSGDAMGYMFEIFELPSADFAYAGIAENDGQNSKIRLMFDTAGLYDFDFGNNNGRYQLLLNTDDNDYIQKTVENNSSVKYYVPAGTHDLIIMQDSATNGGWTEWDVSISLDAANDDSLPYAQSGGNLGGDISGVANVFTEEWLPISLASDADVNLNINAGGFYTTDSFLVEVYEAGSNVADYTLTQVLSDEEQWTNFSLSAGMNRLKIVANNSNRSPLDYSLDISAVPTNGTMSWSGNVLAAGLMPKVQVDFATAGYYQFNIDSEPGFANLVLDDNMAPTANAIASNLQTNYDLYVEAGSHEIYVIQDTSYPSTTWTASVASTSAGPQFFEFNGILDAGESVTPIYPVPDGDMLDFNFSLEVSGDTSLAITDGSGTNVWSGSALGGETIWGTGTLSGTNELMLSNTSGGTADVTLTLYHIPDAGYTWDGLAQGANVVNSEIRVNFPTSGLYTFDLNTNSGVYQFLLNNDATADYIQKTVGSSASDTVAFFVPAGMQTLLIDQDSNAVNTDWDLTISDVGDSHDSLPYEKVGGIIGADFIAEWLPINLSAATEVNIATTITGTVNDSVVLNVLNASDAVIDTITVNGTETSWMTLDLPAGTSRIEANAAGNPNSIEYEVMVTEIPSAANYMWDGNAIDIGENSHIRVSFASSGIYSFTQGLDNGRYQFLVNDDYVQKTVETDGSVAYYIPAGTHDLAIDQDSASGADWDLGISGPIASMDTLPYAKMGGELGGDLGGTANDFTEEWLPIHVGQETSVNAMISIDGDTADGVSIEIWDATSLQETIQPVFGTESVWATFTLPADGRIYIEATGNTSPVDYDITIIDLPTPTFSWYGTSLSANSLHSTIEMDMEVGGTYNIVGNYPEGFASLIIDPAKNAPLSIDADLNMDVELDAGMHTFIVSQEASFPSSTWVYTITLVSAYEPTITAVTPDSTLSGMSKTITIDGTNFLDGAVVKLMGSSTVTLATTWVSGSQLTAVVPNDVAIGTYDVQIMNPDNQSATLDDGFAVVYNYVFLPIILND